MPIVSIVVALVVAGVLLWVVTTYVPMHPAIRNLVVAVVVVALVVWVLQRLGVFHWPIR